jgi:hypothetical protein
VLVQVPEGLVEMMVIGLVGLGPEHEPEPSAPSADSTHSPPVSAETALGAPRWSLQ